MSSESITRNDLEAILNEVFPAATEDMTQDQIDAFLAALNIHSSDNTPYVWKLQARSITQNAGTKDYWTMPDTMLAKSGYTRVPIAYGTSNSSVCPVGTLLASDNTVKVQTYNYAGSSQTSTLYCLYLWLRDDLIVGA